MALQLRVQRSNITRNLSATFVAIFALLMQPLVTLNLPAAFAVGTSIDGESFTIDQSNTSYSKTTDTSQLANVKLTFNYDASSLEASTGTGKNSPVEITYSAGTASGSVVITGEAGEQDSEKDSITLNGVPAQSNLQVSIMADDVSDFSSNDEIKLTNITVSGDAIVPAYAYDFSVNGSSNFIKNEAKEFTVTTTTSDQNNNGTPMVRAYFTTTPNAGGNYEYKDTGGNYQPFDGTTGFGPSAGFEYQNGITSDFRATYPAVGNYDATITFREVSTDQVIATDTVSFSVSEPVAAPTNIVINNSAELDAAINSQADGQTWTINAGDYAVNRNNTKVVNGEAGWYMPITANNLTIKGVGNPTLYGNEYSANGNLSSQNLLTVFGGNVKISGLTLMPAPDPNKTIEVLGSNFTLTDTTISPNTKVPASAFDNVASGADRDFAKQWGGSIYFSHAGNHTLRNVTINNAGVSFRYAPANTHITFDNVKIVHETNIDSINAYRYSSGFNQAANTTAGLPKVIYNVNSTLNNLDSVLTYAADGDTASINSDLTVDHQATIKKALTINGNNKVVTANFGATGNDNNSVFGLQGASNVVINNLTADAAGKTNLHAINIYESTGVELNNVIVKNSAINKYGLNVNDSQVTVTNLHTVNNGYAGVDVDKGDAKLTIEGVSLHDEGGADVYVDNKDDGSVVDSNNQYNVRSPLLRANDALYTLKPIDITDPSTPVNGEPNNKYLATNEFDFTWSASTDENAVKYEFQSTRNAAQTNGVLTTDLWESDPLDEPKIHSSGAPDGTWYWQVRAIDAAGNTSNWSQIWNVTLDTKKPTVQITKPSTSQRLNVRSTNNKLAIEGTAEDDSNFNYYYCYVSATDGREVGTRDAKCQTAWAKGTPSKTAFSDSANGTTDGTLGSIDLTGVANGNYTVHVVAKDKAGNTTEATQDFVLDNSRPTITVNPLSSRYNPTEFTVTGNEADTTLAIVTGNIYNENNTKLIQSCSKDVSSQNVKTYTLTCLTSGLAEGTYTIKANTKDAAGNLSNTDSNTQFVIDRTAPGQVQNVVISDDNGAIADGGATKDSSVTATWTNVPEAVKYEYCYWNDNTATSPYREMNCYTTFPTTESQSGTFTEGEGMHHVKVRAIDAAGNLGQWSATFDVTYDKTAPVVSMNEPTRNANGTYTVTGTSTDSTPVVVSLDGVEKATVTPNNGAWTYTTDTPINDGNQHTFTSTSADAAGNTSSTASRTFTASSNNGGTSGQPTITPPVLVNPAGPLAPASESADDGQANRSQPLLAGIPSFRQQDDLAFLAPGENADRSDVLASEDNKLKGEITDKAAKSSNADVLGDSDEDGCYKIFGLCWYWWIPIVAAVAAIVWFIKKLRDEDDSVDSNSRKLG